MVPMMVVLVLVLVSSNALGAEACEAPRLHDLAPLATAAAQDKVVSQTFSKTAEVCAERGPACDQARAECGALLTSIIQKQVVFDEGVWLRDMLLPYQGQQYPLSKVFGAAAIAPDASCNVDVATLTAAAQRRLVQANRRETLFSEYSSYARWCQAAHQKCLERLSVDDQRAATAKAEAEKLAAAAAAASAASAAELARRQVEDAARKQAQETARRAKEAQATAAAELASREKARVEAEEKARRDQLERHERTKDERERAAAQAEAQRKDTEEERAVKERDARTKQARTQRAQLLADAEAALKVAQAQEETKKQAAIDAVVANPTVAQASVAEAAQAKQARLEAEKRLADARLKAERMEIDESHERSRGHVGLLAGGGVMSWGVPQIAGGVGALVTAHFGFWGSAPLNSLAAGFELALALRFLQPLGATANGREFGGRVTARYFFGPLGLGATGEFRLVDPSYGVRAFGVGPALGLAFIDTPHARVVAGLNWLPVGTSIELTRVTGEVEVSWYWFTLRLLGGSFGATTVGWQASAFVGVRLDW
jgi:hypothetical protein